MNLPNKLTILRMIMIVPFVVFMLVPIGGAAGKWIMLRADKIKGKEEDK